MSPRVRPLALVAVLLASFAGCGETRLDYDEDRVRAEQSEIAREEGFLPVPEAPTEDAADVPEPEPEPVGESSGYPAEADAICEEVSRAFAETQTAVPRSFEQAEELMSALSEIAAEGEAALSAVVPPAESSAAFESYLAARAEVVDLIDEGLEAARGEDGEAYQRARERVVEGARDRERLARAANLRRCAAGEGA